MPRVRRGNKCFSRSKQPLCTNLISLLDKHQKNILFLKYGIESLIKFKCFNLKRRRSCLIEIFWNNFLNNIKLYYLQQYCLWGIASEWNQDMKFNTVPIICLCNHTTAMFVSRKILFEKSFSKLFCICLSLKKLVNEKHFPVNGKHFPVNFSQGKIWLGF